MVADTMGGRMHVRWDESAQATPHGQLVFFAEFLATAGVFDQWVQACPLRYTSQGWQAIEDSIKLSGWSKSRRVVVLRRRIKRDIALTQRVRGNRA